MSKPFVPLLVHIAAPLTATPMPAEEQTVAPPVDLDAVRAAAYAAGAEDARLSAHAHIAEMESKIAALAPLVSELAGLRKIAIGQAADDVAKLVTELAHKVIGDALTVHPDALARLVHGAIARLPDEDEVWIHVPLLAVDHVMSMLPERYRSRVIADPALEKGCVVETRHASIDASLETAVAGVAAATQQWLSSRS